MWIDIYRDTAERELEITDEELEEVGFDGIKQNIVSVDIPTMLLSEYLEAYDYCGYGNFDGFLKNYVCDDVEELLTYCKNHANGVVLRHIGNSLIQSLGDMGHRAWRKQERELMKL